MSKDTKSLALAELFESSVEDLLRQRDMIVRAARADAFREASDFVKEQSLHAGY